MKNLCTYCCTLMALLLSVVGCDRRDESVEGPGFMVIDGDISNHKVNAFAEDGFGYIWIATHRGLNRYNGIDFHQYYNTADSLSLSDNQVMSLLVDSGGDVWAGTVNVVSRLTREGYFVNIPLATTNQSRYVVQLFETSRGEILANNYLALERYDREQEAFRPLVTFAPELGVSRCYEDPSGRIWVVARRGLTAYDIENMQRVRSVDLDFGIQSSFQGRGGILWLLCTDGRIRLFDTQRGSVIETPAALRPDGKLAGAIVTAIYEYSATMLVLYTSDRQYLLYDTLSGGLLREGDADFPFTPPATDVTTMFVDSKLNLWIGSSDQGFTVVNRSKRQFNDNTMLAEYFDGRSVISLSGDRAGNVWALTSLEGLHMIDHSTRQARRIAVPEETPGRKMTECYVDTKDRLWITFDGGRVIQCRYRSGEGLVREAGYDLGSVIFCIIEDPYGNIWAGAFGSHVCVLSPGESEFRRVEIIPPDSRFTPVMLSLRGGRVLAASVDRGFEFIDPLDGSIERIDMRGKVRRSTFIPISLFEAADGTIWCGTLGNGLFTVDPNDMTVTHRDGAQCDDISSIAQDAQGNMWISTLDGILKYDTAAEAFFVYHGGDGIGGDQFNENCVVGAFDNSILFGGTHGITFFDPVDIVPRRTADIVFEDLAINNVVQQAYKSDAIDRQLSLKPDVTLRHGKNNFSISYVAMEFGWFPRNNYHYMLDGFDSDWIDARHNRQAFYSNLPPGRYDFRVRATNNSNMGVLSEDSIRVVVKPSPWLSGTMVWGVYPMLLLLLAGSLLRLWIMAERNRHAAELATIEKENEVRTNTMNMYFFSNISHEFRTPLTMISGPVEMLASAPGLERRESDLLSIVRRNVDRMLRLGGQLMGFNKLGAYTI